MPKDIDIINLIDRLERHKAAAEGISDLKIGMRTVAADYEDCILMLFSIRKSLMAS